MKTFTEWVTIVGYVFSAFVVAVHLLSLIWEYLPRHWRLAALIWVRGYLSAALMEVNASIYEIDPRCSCGAALAVPEDDDQDRARAALISLRARLRELADELDQVPAEYQGPKQLKLVAARVRALSVLGTRDLID